MRVDTPLGKDVLVLRGFTGSEAVSEPFAFTLELISTKEDIDPKKLLRKAAVLKWKTPKDTGRIVHGLIRSFRKVGRRDDLHLYSAEVVPWLWFLTLSQESRIHQGKSVIEIIELVFKDLGFSDFSIKTKASYPKREYCVQYRESHFNFVSRLMEEEGIFYYFEHTADKHTLVLADGNSALPEIMEGGGAFIQQNAADLEDVVTSLEVEDNVFSGKITLRSYDFLQPKLSLEASIGEGESEQYDYPGTYLSVEEGNRYARIRLEAEEATQKVITGGGNCRTFVPGHKAELKERGKGTAHKLMLLQVNHTMQGNAVRAWEQNEQLEYRNMFSGIPIDTPYRPPRRAPKSLVRGTQTALVCTTKGEEIWSEKYGRIKVQFYWDRKGAKDEKSSCWIRVATPWAGTGWGAVSIPRMGQEVVVDFLEGDPDRPLIIGSVYNDDHMPPYQLPANVTQSGIKSRSSKDGEGANFNEIRMEDKKGSEMLYIHAEKDKQEEVENDNTENVGNDESVAVGNDRERSVGGNETITIDGNRTESVGGNETISIEKNRTHEVTGNDSLSVDENRTVKVTKNDTTSVTKNASLAIGENWTVTVTKDHKETVDKNYTLKAKEVMIEGTDQVEIKSGSASILLKKNGDITIKGGKINIKGSGDVIVKGSKIGEN